MGRTSNKVKEVTSIKRYINANELIKVASGLRTKEVDDATRLDKRNYLLALLYHKHKVRGDELKDIFKFKTRASITNILGQVYELRENKAFLSNIEEVKKLYDFNLSRLSPREKDKVGPYTVTVPVSLSDIMKLEKRSAELNITVRKLIRNVLRDASLTW